MRVYGKTGQLRGVVEGESMLRRKPQGLFSRYNWPYNTRINPAETKVCGNSSWSWVAAVSWALHGGKLWDLVIVPDTPHLGAQVLLLLFCLRTQSSAVLSPRFTGTNLNADTVRLVVPITQADDNVAVVCIRT